MVVERRGRSPARIALAASVAILVLATLLLVLRVPLGGASDKGDSIAVKGHPLLGEPAPDIDLRTLDRQRVTLSSLRGRPVLVNFWASWCIPCRDEFPLMVAASSDHAADGLAILGVIHDDDPERARAFAGEYGATWPMLDDADDVAWRDYLGVGLPTSFFVDADGTIRAFSLGGFTKAGLEAMLERILPPS